jgi:DinB superfamily
MDRAAIETELSWVETDFAALVSLASRSDLRRGSSGTRWTNRQLLYHMVFGYLIVRTLMPLVHLLGRWGRSKTFAAALNAARRPFHAVNYFGSWAGGQIVPPAATVSLMRRTLRALRRRLDGESEHTLALTMHFPTDWDPYFRPTMSVRDVYHYGTEHYEHHRRQLTLA